MPKYNTENLAGINAYHNNLAKQIDEAEWIGKLDEADTLRDELQYIEKLRDGGALYVPLF